MTIPRWKKRASRSNAPMVISHVSMSDWAGTWEVVTASSYIAEIAPTALAAGKPGGAFDTFGDLTLAAPPFLPKCVAHRKPVLGPHGPSIRTHAALGKAGDFMG